MPETIRTANERLRSRPRRGGFLAAFVIATSFLTFGTPARAEAGVLGALLHQDAGRLYLIASLIVFGLLAVAVLQRRLRSMRADSAPLDEAVELRSEADRLKTLLLSEPQVLVEWAAASDEPNILGDTSIFVPGERAERVLAFGAWLTPASAQDIEHAVETLRGEGRGFVVTLTTARGNPVKAQGRAIGGRAVLRLRDLGGIEQELIDLTARYEGLSAEVAIMTSLLDSLPTPVWARDADGRLAFVNAAYARAVDAADSTDAVGRNLELLDRPAREQIAQQRAANKSFAARLPAIVTGRRRIFDVIVSPAAAGSASIAIDRTEAEAMRAELGRMIEAHRRVLDQVATGVAIFNVDRKLIFYNAPFRSLFELDAALLDQMPTDSALLDTLRTARKLPEEQDFRLWKQQLYEAYRAVEPREHMWHLPNGRTLRVITTPNPEGGVTYLYDDVTERLDLGRRYEALIKVQSETLDHLAEAVAVFGSDGRVRLHNPAFQRMWKLNAETLNEHPHVDSVTAWCQALHDESNVWRALRAAVTTIDEREPIVERIDRRDGATINLATMPLPDGATLVTFQDVTDTVNVERALRERNEALEAADGIKIGFVHNVSYELRSPLTNIIGFANLLDDPAFGPLTVKQHEYLGYITSSTNALLAIINNILDLATIDAGAMTLNLGEVDIRACMEAAAEGVQDRLVKDGLRLEIQTPPAIGSFTADERRLRQILFNLLSNAIGFSPPGGAIVLAAIRAPDAVVFSVADSGPGIPPEAMDKVFDWFESDPRGSQHRGPGLGLTLVRSFVELHGGTVTIESAPSQGTTVTCVFPQEHSLTRTAA